MDKIANSDIFTSWKPDRQSKEPIYSQIVTYISKLIASGKLVSGQKLPAQRELSRIFEVNRSTIVEAMDELTALCLIESNHGSGTRIADNGWNMLIQDKAPDWQSYIKAGSFQSNIPTIQIINHVEFQPGIMRLNTGELSPTLMQTEIMKEILNSLSLYEKELFMNYPDPLGMPSLRTAVQNHLRRSGIEVPISCILIVSGALQALQLISTGIVKAGTKIYTESPSWLGSLNIFQSIGANLVSVPMDANGLLPWKIQESRGQAGHSLLFTIPTFQNPTGIVMPISRRKEILQYCGKTHIPIIEDDVFRDLWLDESPPPPIKSMDHLGNIIYIGSISKCFSPGLRVGWLVGTESVVQRLADIKMQMDYGVSVLSQQVVERLLESGQYYIGVDRIRRQLRWRRDHMMNLLEKYFGDMADWDCPSGGFYVWVRFKKRIDTEKLFDRALAQGLLIMPGYVYDRAHSYSIRLTFGYLSPEDMEYGVRQLAEILKAL